jgi:hypothetical protein
VIRGIIPARDGKGPRYLLEGEGETAFLRMNSNSYLGMSFQAAVVAAEEDAARTFGTGPGAVRFISGTASVQDENPQHSFEHKAGRDRLAPRIAADDAGQMAIAAAGPVSGQPLLWRTAITLTSIFRHTASMEFATVNDKANEEGRRNAWPFLACYRCCDRSGCGDWFWA